MKLRLVRITTDEAGHESIEIHSPCDDQFHNVSQVDENALMRRAVVSQSAFAYSTEIAHPIHGKSRTFDLDRSG
jgi:hypothetical protein